MQDVVKESESKMQKSMDALKMSFAAVRTGRASPALLDHVMVDYYGSPVSLKQLASVSVPDPRCLFVIPFDKNAAAEIEKAIMQSDLGINPKREAAGIRLSLPEPSEERRRELVKIIKKGTEDSKVSIRNIRRDAIEILKGQKKDKTITEDDEKNLDKKVQDLTNKYCSEADKLFSAKEKEVMEV
ncbi:ribosome recycling factor [candidate division WOR-1 bacterium RIFOXYB2_FULL_42_35]|uniref:Ribosome-recycling factor n=1 Tax=candidate division WOR-1 bacterium RIFOXYC2_FULL_41_25 TaxID=1802586 RepID=A0A1F4TRK1_UNCSA|nr:MAG: ribosome recycling factor [candidate division WOR-1 bacterium RIFOXYA2_FULL_41_14]OGC25838.1 MAG: ribosome recycling factor [candidate division WOR-1 bacterium RIFOXYB2_FULL_42_35]OGC35278.1 MAG: ribosome recycling factor [candidate division WOR-1 bacterium RIFOXYC2_FULL_41_25]OGC41639.1 MAG: ribosome recycling factor [candidate division WOR-1 bacterium RIFOXYD2_FULL_41_8]